MKNLEFTRAIFVENGYQSYRRDVENLNAYEYCYISTNLPKLENYQIRIYIYPKYDKFSFNFFKFGTSYESNLTYPISIDDNEYPSQLQRLQFVLKYLKGTFPTFKFEEELEV